MRKKHVMTPAPIDKTNREPIQDDTFNRLLFAIGEFVERCGVPKSQIQLHIIVPGVEARTALYNRIALERVYHVPANYAPSFTVDANQVNGLEFYVKTLRGAATE